MIVQTHVGCSLHDNMQAAGCRLLCLFRWLSHLILIAILCMFLLRHGLTWILNKQIKQYRPEHSWSSGTIRVFVLCLSAFVLVMLFSSPPISLQFRLQCLHSIALCMWTQKSDYAATPPPLPSPPPTPLFFFFFTHWQVLVPWQRPWRHRWLDVPPLSALFSKFSFGTEWSRLQVAWGIRCAC